MPDLLPLRVAMLSIHTCPLAMLGGKETGGMNVYVRELARELGRRGFPVDIYTRSQDPAIPRISMRLGASVRVIHLPAGPELPYDKNKIYLHLPGFVEEVLAFARHEDLQYDLLHSHYWLSGLAAVGLRDRWGSPVIHMSHTLGEVKNRVATSPADMEPPLRIQEERNIIRLADRLVAATALEREDLLALYEAEPQKITVIPPGVDLEMFHPVPCTEARARIGLPQRHQMVLFVGRIQPIKGIDTLIRAMALVLQRYPSLHGQLELAIIGGGGSLADGEMGRLEQLRKTLGVEDLVTFLGSRNQDTLVDYYNAASMVVVPSHHESFGMVALEAMACGTPVIASDVGGLSLNVADGFNGYLVPSGDVEALAYKIGLLLTQPELRRHLGEQARQWAQRFDWPTIADEILAVYADALGRTVSETAPWVPAIRKKRAIEDLECP